MAAPNVISVASPDKLSLAMFLDFLKHVLGREWVFGDTHNLMTAESFEAYLTGFLKNYPRAVISYYAKRQINIDPLKAIPQKIIDSSEAVVWFKLYSTEPVFLKDTCGFELSIGQRWKLNVERLNAQK